MEASFDFESLRVYLRRSTTASVPLPSNIMRNMLKLSPCPPQHPDGSGRSGLVGPAL
jgi:hypothetical protein